MWFLGRRVAPNLVQLENAIEQTTGKRTNLNEEILKEKLIKRISEADFGKITGELNIFLVDKNELKYITIENLRQLVDRMYL